MGAAAVPAIIQAGSAMYGAWQARKKSKAAEAERSTALGGAQGVSNTLVNSGTGLTNLGMPAAQRSLGYYQTLLGGNRAQMAQATAGPRGAITDQYRGAERSLEQGGVRGAVGDLAKAELSRDRVGRIAGLTSGVQPMAAAAVGDLGSNLMSQGGNRLGAAGGLWGGLLGQAGYNSRYYNDESTAAGTALSKSIYDLAAEWAKRKN